MLELFTKLPLKNLEVLVSLRQAVRNSLKNLIFLAMTIFRTSSKLVFQVTTEEHSLLSFVCKLSLSLLSHPSTIYRKGKEGKRKFTYKGQQAVLFSSDLKDKPARGSKYCQNKRYHFFSKFRTACL